MKVIRNTLWVLGIAALSACTMDEMDSAFDKVPVEFSVVDSAAVQMTRATSSITTFNSGETVKVYVKPNGASSYTGYDYTTAAAGNAPSLTAPSTPPYFPAGSSTTVQAYAYYPSTAGTTFSVKTDQTSDANYKASDLMYASNRTITKGSTTGTALAMSHKMAQLKLVVAAASGSGLSISSVKVNAKYQASFTASSGAVSVTGSATDITALSAAGTGYILIPPQAINGITVKVTASSQVATYTFTSTNSLEAGKSYTMNLTVGLNDVGVTTSISTWTGSGSVTVNPTVVNTPLTVMNVTSSNVGWLIANDGYVYQTVSNIPQGKTAVAMICYVYSGAGNYAVRPTDASGNYRGLAMALQLAASYVYWCNQGTETCMVAQYSSLANALDDLDGIKNTQVLVDHVRGSHTAPAATAAVNYKNTVAPPTGTSGWFLPSAGQINLMMKGLIGYGFPMNVEPATKVNEKLSNAGLNNISFGKALWSSTQKNSSDAYRVIFIYDGVIDLMTKNNSYDALPVLAF